MSGGYFDYVQYRLQEPVEDIEKILSDGKYYEDAENEIPDDVRQEFKKGIHYIKLANVYLQRIDWLLSGDDGEDAFISRLIEDLKKLNKEELVELKNNN